MPCLTHAFTRQPVGWVGSGSLAANLAPLKRLQKMLKICHLGGSRLRTVRKTLYTRSQRLHNAIIPLYRSAGIAVRYATPPHVKRIQASSGQERQQPYSYGRPIHSQHKTESGKQRPKRYQHPNNRSSLFSLESPRRIATSPTFCKPPVNTSFR